MSESIGKRITIIIPSLSPDDKLLKVVKELKEAGFRQIVIVNDGSDEKYNVYFNQVREMGCYVLVHKKNQGKGRALKTAFRYVKDNISNCEGVITVDADGQHAVSDILRCGEAMLEHPNQLILGCRNFKESGVPFRSRFGNQVTSKVFMMFMGLRITDTQTGLRAIPISLLDIVLQVEGERFEYETNVLIKTKEHNICIYEVPISTIYIEENKTSHFNPIKDSIMIYKLFLKFILASISSFAIDIILFTIFSTLLKGILPLYYIAVATATARIISSVYNYCINRSKVFEQKEKSNRSVIRYYLLVVLQMVMSALLVTLIHIVTPINTTIIKIIVDSILFLFSFAIQREWVFR